MMGGFSTGIQAYWPAWNLIRAGNFWRYLWIPGLISLALGMGLIAAGISQAGKIAGGLIAYYPFETGRALVQALAGVTAGILTVAVVILLFRYVVMVLVTPFMSLLSEKIETRLTGLPSPDFSFPGLLSDLWRGVRIALRNIWRELFYSLLLLIAGLFIPVLGQVGAAVGIFLIQAYYAGFGNMDYTLERRKYTVKQSVAFVRAHRGLALGNGAVFILLLMVPVIGLFLAPAWGTAAATLGLVKANR